MSINTLSAPRVRFAPSPTGRLHVGNVRTALINWLFAQSLGGSFMLRIDDTDTERSTKENEALIKADLNWLGIEWAVTFNQSERFDKYDTAAQTLKEKGFLYPCYETSEELDQMRKVARAQGKPPIYNRAALALTADERKAHEDAGRTPHWRFKLSGQRVEWVDLVRGAQSIATKSLSDPILIRGDGSYLYTLPSVVDDIEYAITHVVRGEDHVTNSGAQIEIFQALGGESPQMAHTPLLIWKDGSPLSKRLGSLGIGELATQGVEPIAICSHLAKLGTSDNIALADSLDDLVAAFDFAKIGRAPARFDDDDLKSLSAEHVHTMPFDVAQPRLAKLDTRLANADIWQVIRENCGAVEDAAAYIDVMFGEITAHLDDQSDAAYIAAALAALPDGVLDGETWGAWTKSLKAETGRKGRGLFMPLRIALTGLKSGPNMADVLPLLGRDLVEKRLKAASAP